MIPTHRRVRRALVPLLALLLSCGACQSSNDDTSAAGSAGGGQSPPAGSILELAREGGASKEQLDVLRTQAPTFESYQTAVDKALACIRRAGIDVIGDSVVRDSGYPEIAYSFAASSAGRSDEQTLALADACVAEHSRWVEEAYLTSPRVVEAKELQFDPYRSALTTCLAELGVELPTDATRGEILVAAAEAATTEGRDCIDEVGYAP